MALLVLILLNPAYGLRDAIGATPGAPGVTTWIGRLPSNVSVRFVPFDPT